MEAAIFIYTGIILFNSHERKQEAHQHIIQFCQFP